MVHLVHLEWWNFIEKRNKFYYVNITYDYVTDFT